MCIHVYLLIVSVVFVAILHINLKRSANLSMIYSVNLWYWLFQTPSSQ